MLDVMALFHPLSYNPMAESKYHRENKAPRLEYDFMPESTGVNDLFDKKFHRLKGIGPFRLGSKKQCQRME